MQSKQAVGLQDEPVEGTIEPDVLDYDTPQVLHMRSNRVFYLT